jgi:hypothetical protein
MIQNFRSIFWLFGLSYHLSSVSAIIVPRPCGFGSYCPVGASNQIPCAPGSYSNASGAESCTPCPPGSICASSGMSTPDDCPAAFFCPGNTSIAYPCPAGTASNSTRMRSASECQSCPSGYYCQAAGKTTPTGLCSAGYICFKGATTSTPQDNITGRACIPGESCKAGSSSASPCIGGRYCSDPTGTPDGLPCSAGYYCRSASFTPTPEGQISLTYGLIGDICPSGSYCGNGSYTSTPCPSGYYSGSRGASTNDTCVICPGGSVCSSPGLSSPDALCAPGYFCVPGSTSPTPSSGLCPKGAWCSANSSAPTQCIAGRYQNETGSSALNCLQCPAGHYCPGISTIIPIPCIAGRYCPAGSAAPMDCPRSTYSTTPLANSSLVCISCPPGYACPTAASTTPLTCEAGYYCVRGSISTTPVATGTTIPDFGSYIGVVGVTSYNATSIAIIGGDICPLGHYCPRGSPAPIACATGTFLNATGAPSDANCTRCLPGFYCPSQGLVVPVHRCPAGYFCSGGNILGTETVAQPGFYADVGSDAQKACSQGTYSNRTGLAVCDICPERYACGLQTSSPLVCKVGFYCPVGTSLGDEQPCPSGTFNNRTGLAAEAECTKCLPGQYCGSTGLAMPTGPCTQGYVCTQGANISMPIDQITGYVCPAGHFCITGSSLPTKCPPGTMNNATGGISLSSCLLCRAGYTCPNPGTINPTELCAPGYYCPGGDITSTLNCTKGNYCAGGNSAPVACTQGTYTSGTGRSSCDICPAGSWCGLATSVPQPCAAGFYCDEGSNQANDQYCPSGTYNNRTGASQQSDCLPCPPGYYCTAATSTPTLKCGPGYYCSGGSSSPQPTDQTGGQCQQGYVCLLGASAPIPDITDPTQGYPCPKGHRCIAGSGIEDACPAGQYQPSNGSSTCLECLPGRYCPGATIVPLLCPAGSFCKAGSGAPTKCQNGTWAGVSSPTGLMNQSQCAECPEAVYCQGGVIAGPCAPGHVCYWGNDRPDPTATLPNPFENGGKCPLGFYCDGNTTNIYPCPNNTYTQSLGSSSVTQCSSCPRGNRCVSGNPLPIPCYAGGYCADDGTFFSCPMFTYNPYVGSYQIESCLPCAAGYFCNATGISTLVPVIYNAADLKIPNPPNLYLCPVGFYCPVRTMSPVPCAAGSFSSLVGGVSQNSCAGCLSGHFCPLASTAPVACPPGFFCPGAAIVNGTLLGAANATACRGGYYCPSKSSVPIDCPAGSYCPPLSASPIQCPIGSFCVANSPFPAVCPPGYRARADSSPTSRNSLLEACQACPAGTYAEGEDGLNCLPCTAGYVCLGNTRISMPQTVENDGGYPCPPGFFCPLGSSVPSPCPAGTFNGLPASASSSACLPCANNTYSVLTGQPACRPCSASAYTKSLGQTTCECRGKYRSFQATDGFCVCAPSYQFVDELGAILSEEDGEQDCQPAQYARCPPGERRLPSGGCASIDCNAITQCASGSGTYNAAMGLCQCLGLPTLDQICDSACRAAGVQMSIDPVSGKLMTTDPGTGVTTLLDPATDIPGFLGSLACPLSVSSTTVNVTISRNSTNTTLLLNTSITNSTNTTNPTGATGSSSPCEVFTLNVASSGGGFSGVYNAPVTVLAASQAKSRRLQSADIPASVSAQKPTNAYVSSSVYDTIAKNAMLRQIELAHRIRTSGVPPLSSSSSSESYAPRLTSMSSRILSSSTSSGSGTCSDGSTGACVQSPLTCLSLGQSLIFSLNWTLPPFSYPVYVKDSLLNTNPNFDYGLFRSLASMAAAAANTTSANAKKSLVNVFAFPFLANGTYIFATSTDSATQVIVVVMPPGARCPVGGAFVPKAYDSLVTLGISTSTQPVLAPNWILLGAIYFLLLFIGSLLALCINWHVRRSYADNSWKTRMRNEAIAGLLKGLPSLQSKSLFGNKFLGINGGGDRPPFFHPATLDWFLRMFQVNDSDDEGGIKPPNIVERDKDGLTASQRSALDRFSEGKAGAMVTKKFDDGLGSDWGTSAEDAESLALRNKSKLMVVNGEGDVIIAGLDPEDLDLATLADKLRTHQERTIMNFAEQRREGKSILDAIHDEADGIRKMVAMGVIASSSIFSQMSSLPPSAQLAARRAVVLREIEAEISARAMHERSLAKKENEIRDSLLTLSSAFKGPPPSSIETSVAVVSELVETLGGADLFNSDILKRDELRNVSATDSVTAEDIRRCAEQTITLFNSLMASVVRERERRSQGVSMWLLAAQAMTLIPSSSASNPQLTEAVRSIELLDNEGNGPLDGAMAGLLDTVSLFTSTAKDSLSSIRTQLNALVSKALKAAEKKNPSILKKAAEEVVQSLTPVFSDFIRALESQLFEKLPAARQSLDSARENASALSASALPAIRSARAAAELEADNARISTQAAKSAISQLSLLVDDIKRGSLNKADVKGNAASLATVLVLSADDEEDRVTSSEEDKKLAASIVAAAEAQARKEHASLVDAMASSVAKASAEAAANAAKERNAALRGIMNDPTITQAERARLVAEFDADQESLKNALEAEATRQANELKKRLDNRRKQLATKNLKRAEADAQANAEARAKLAMKAAADAQAQALLAMSASLEAADASERLALDKSIKETASLPSLESEEKAVRARETCFTGLSLLETAFSAETARLFQSLDTRMRSRRVLRAKELSSQQDVELASCVRIEDRLQMLETHLKDTVSACSQLSAEDAADIQQASVDSDSAVKAFEAKVTALCEAFSAAVADASDSAEEESRLRLAKANEAVAKSREAKLSSVVDPQKLNSLKISLDFEAEEMLRAHESSLAACQTVITSIRVEAKLLAARCATEAILRSKQISSIQSVISNEAEVLRSLQTFSSSPAIVPAGWLQADVNGRLSVVRNILAKLESGVPLAANEPVVDATVVQNLLIAAETCEKNLAESSAGTLSNLSAEAESRLRDLEKEMEAISKRDFVESERNRIISTLERKVNERIASRRVTAKKADMLSDIETREKELSADFQATLGRLKECLSARISSAHKEHVQISAIRTQQSVASANAEAQSRAGRRSKELSNLIKSIQTRSGPPPINKWAALFARQTRETFAAQSRQASIDELQTLASTHAAEAAALRASLIDEKASSAAAAEQRQFELEQAKMAAASQKAADAAISKLRGDYEAEAEQHQRALQGEEARQKASLEARLRARRAEKLRKVAADQAEELFSMGAGLAAGDAVSSSSQDKNKELSSSSTEAAQKITESVLKQLDSIVPTVSAADKAAIAKAEAEAKQRAEFLEKKQKEEREKAEAEAAADAAKEVARMASEAEARKRAQLEAKQRELEAKINAAQSHSEQDAERVRKEFDSEMRAYEAQLDSEKLRQTDKVKAQLEARRARKERELARKQEAERSAEASRVLAEAAEAEAKAAAAREAAALASAAALAAAEADTATGSGVVSQAIDEVLQVRHARETSELLSRQYGERSRELRVALERVTDKKRDEIADLSERLKDASASAVGTSTEIAERFDASFAAELVLLNARFEKEKADVQAACIEEIELRHAREQLNLRQRQLGEVADTYAKLAPEAVLQRHEAEEARKEANELAAFQENLQKQREMRLNDIKKHKAEAEEKARRENEMELARIEAEHAAQLSAEKAKADEQLRIRKARMKDEEEKARAELLKESGSLDVAARDKALAAFEAEQKAVESKLDLVRQSQQASLEAKLAERRAKAKKKVEQKLNDAIREADTNASKEAAHSTPVSLSSPSIVSATADSSSSLASLVERTSAKASALFDSPSAVGNATTVPLQQKNDAVSLVSFAVAAGGSLSVPVPDAIDDDADAIDLTPDEVTLTEAMGMLDSAAITGSHGTALLAKRLERLESLITTLVERNESADSVASPLLSQSTRAAETKTIAPQSQKESVQKMKGQTSNAAPKSAKIAESAKSAASDAKPGDAKTHTPSPRLPSLSTKILSSLSELPPAVFPESLPLQFLSQHLEKSYVVESSSLSPDQATALDLFVDIFRTLNLFSDTGSTPVVSISPVSAIPLSANKLPENLINSLQRAVYLDVNKRTSDSDNATFKVFVHRLVLSSIGDVVTAAAISAAHIKAALYFVTASPDDISCGNHIGFEVNDEGPPKRARAFAASVASCMTAVGQVAFSRRATEVTRARSATPSRALQIFRKVTGSVMERINVISRFSKESTKSSSARNESNTTSPSSSSPAMTRLLERKNTLTKSLMTKSIGLQRKPSIPQIEQHLSMSKLQKQPSSLSLLPSTARSLLLPSETLLNRDFATGSLPERLSAFHGIDTARRTKLESYFQKIERDVLEDATSTDLEEVEEVETVLTKDEFNDAARSLPDFKANLTQSLSTVVNSLDRANRVFVIANQALQESTQFVSDMEKKEEAASNRLRRIKKAHRINKILMGIDEDDGSEASEDDSIDLDAEEYDRTLGGDPSQPELSIDEKRTAIQAHYLSFSISDAELEKEAACVQVLESRMNVRASEEAVAAIASRIDRLEKQREQLEKELK